MAELHVHTLVVRDHKISCCDATMVQHGMGHDAIALDLDGEWDGLSLRVVLGAGDDAGEKLWDGGPWEVPASLLAEVGWLPVSVVGYGGDGTVRVANVPEPVTISALFGALALGFVLRRRRRVE